MSSFFQETAIQPRILALLRSKAWRASRKEATGSFSCTFLQRRTVRRRKRYHDEIQQERAAYRVQGQESSGNWVGHLKKGGCNQDSDNINIIFNIIFLQCRFFFYCRFIRP